MKLMFEHITCFSERSFHPRTAVAEVATDFNQFQILINNCKSNSN